MVVISSIFYIQDIKSVMVNIVQIYCEIVRESSMIFVYE